MSLKNVNAVNPKSPKRVALVISNPAVSTTRLPCQAAKPRVLPSSWNW